MKCCIRGLLNQVDYVPWFTFPMFRSFSKSPRIVRRTHGDTGSDTIALDFYCFAVKPQPSGPRPSGQNQTSLCFFFEWLSVISGFPRQHSVRALLGETSDPKTTNDKCQATLAMTADICESSTEKTLDFNRHLERCAWLLGQFWRM